MRTDKQDKIHALYKVLLLFEDLTSLEPTIEEADYTTYCERYLCDLGRLMVKSLIH